MTNTSSCSLIRTVIVASVSLAAAGILLTASVEPTMALCKYGTPHCVNPHRPQLPTVGGAKWPDSGWQDPDCKYYGNCNTGDPGQWGDPSISRKAPSGRPVMGRTYQKTNNGGSF
jgi:hypothetical protein